MVNVRTKVVPMNDDAVPMNDDAPITNSDQDQSSTSRSPLSRIISRGSHEHEMMNVLDEKLKAYLEDPNGNLDLSGLGFGSEGAKKIASFLPKW
jgi:hypothetical protein